MFYIFLTGAMGYAGYQDLKYRTIPNRASCLLLFLGFIGVFTPMNTGFFAASATEKICGIFIPFAVLFIVYLINSNLSGGGDLKIISSLGFAIGFGNLMAVLFVACVSALIHHAATGEKYLPMGAHLFIGIVAFCILHNF